ncbi:MAG: A/G-specific adenine glycosylase [Thermoanaerobaculia bacterium]|nr:A/G-specific adenine glycosylase [Thermoanaerobaculia bacterium]
MLQQTQVATVVPRFERFVDRFPSVESLAAASEEEVVAAWSGLGYYQRARRLHRGARQVVEMGRGIPRSVSGLRSISGIGEYTAAAISSIAFGVSEPVLDGNVERVLTRFLALDGDPKRASSRRQLREAARDFLLPGEAGDCNQALMELGATLCSPRRPRCTECPLSEDCQGHLEGRAEDYPQGRRRRATEARTLVAAIVRSRRKVLLSRRSDREKVLAGTWELPWAELLPGTSPAASRRAGSLLAERYGGVWTLHQPQVSVRHAITYRRLEVRAYAATVEGLCYPEKDRGEEAAIGWFDAEERGRLPLSSLVEKLLTAMDRIEAEGVE